MAAITKQVTHAPATTQTLNLSSSTANTVTVTAAVANTGRVWVSTNPSVSMYPWLGTLLPPGSTAAIVTQPGVALYSYAEAPAQLSVTIA
jgi:hypothetical protein